MSIYVHVFILTEWGECARCEDRRVTRHFLIMSLVAGPNPVINRNPVCTSMLPTTFSNLDLTTQQRAEAKLRVRRMLQFS